MARRASGKTVDSSPEILKLLDLATEAVLKLNRARLARERTGGTPKLDAEIAQLEKEAEEAIMQYVTTKTNS